MKIVPVLSTIVLLCASAVFGQAGTIGIYSDDLATNHCLTDVSVGVRQVYVVHKYTPGSTASWWMVQPSAEFSCTHVGDASPFYNVAGNSHTGVQIAYDACLSSNILLLTISYYCYGTSSACSNVEVVPHPDSPNGAVFVVDCEYWGLIASGGRLLVNPDGSCGSCTNATEESTWGQVKGLYQ